MSNAERYIREVIRLFIRLVMFFVYRPKLALLVVIAVVVLEISASLRVFWLLLLGLALLFFGGRLRYRGL
jgi:hypothetical protein